MARQQQQRLLSTLSWTQQQPCWLTPRRHHSHPLLTCVRRGQLSSSSCSAKRRPHPRPRQWMWTSLPPTPTAEATGTRTAVTGARPTIQACPSTSTDKIWVADSQEDPDSPPRLTGAVRKVKVDKDKDKDKDKDNNNNNDKLKIKNDSNSAAGLDLQRVETRGLTLKMQPELPPWPATNQCLGQPRRKGLSQEPKIRPQRPGSSMGSPGRCSTLTKLPTRPLN